MISYYLEQQQQQKQQQEEQQQQQQQVVIVNHFLYMSLIMLNCVLLNGFKLSRLMAFKVSRTRKLLNWTWTYGPKFP